MSAILYMDEDAQDKELIRRVRNAGVFVSCVNEQRTNGWSDEEQLIFASSKVEAIFSHNEEDFEQLPFTMAMGWKMPFWDYPHGSMRDVHSAASGETGHCREEF